MHDCMTMYAWSSVYSTAQPVSITVPLWEVDVVMW